MRCSVHFVYYTLFIHTFCFVSKKKKNTKEIECRRNNDNTFRVFCCKANASKTVVTYVTCMIAFISLRQSIFIRKKFSVCPKTYPSLCLFSFSDFFSDFLLLLGILNKLDFALRARVLS